MKLNRWKYDTAWNRIVTKDRDGLQVVVVDHISPMLGNIMVERMNNILRTKNEADNEKRKLEGDPEKH